MRSVLSMSGLIVALMGRVTAAPQDAGQPAVPPVSAEAVSTCVDAQQRSLRLLDAINERVEMSRQTNSPAEMRAAMAGVQRALLEARTVLGRYATLARAAAASDPHAGHTMPTTQAPTAAPAPAGSAQQPGGRTMVTVQTVLDPAKLSCSPKIDPKAAAQTTYQGKTYYFCSAKERDEFLRDPAMSLSMMPPKQ